MLEPGLRRKGIALLLLVPRVDTQDESPGSLDGVFVFSSSSFNDGAQGAADYIAVSDSADPGG